MIDSFIDYLNEIKPTNESIDVAVRAIISELNDDELPQEMEDKLKTFLTVDSYESIVGDLNSDLKERTQVCLIFLSWLWYEKEEKELIKATFEGIENKMPVIESALLVLTAMYGMYLLIKSRRDVPEKEVTIVKRGNDGIFYEKTVKEYGSVESPIGIMKAFFSGLVKSNK